MTTEERVAKLFREGRNYDAILAAIREAENDILDRAALSLEQLDGEFTWSAQHVRSLKHPEQP